jgi:hypothetical protein
MACDRCNAVRASDGALLLATFTAPNGEPVFLDVRLSASSDIDRVHAAMFCEPCWLFFLESFANRAQMKRTIGV